MLRRRFCGAHTIFGIVGFDGGLRERRQAFVGSGLPANDVVLIKRRKAAFAGTAREIGPGFVGAQVGDKSDRRERMWFRAWRW